MESEEVKLPENIKRGILSKLDNAIYKFTVYPNDDEIIDVAEVLIGKHPCLKST